MNPGGCSVPERAGPGRVGPAALGALSSRHPLPGEPPRAPPGASAPSRHPVNGDPGVETFRGGPASPPPRSEVQPAAAASRGGQEKLREKKEKEGEKRRAAPLPACEPRGGPGRGLGAVPPRPPRPPGPPQVEGPAGRGERLPPAGASSLSPHPAEVGTPGPSLPPSPALCPQFARSPPARSAANKGEEKPHVAPSLPTKTPFVQDPREKLVRGGGGGVAHARLCPEKGYFGRSCCRREERGRSRRFDLFLRRPNFAGEGPSPERGAGLVSPGPGRSPPPPAAFPLRAAGLEPGRGLDFRGKKKKYLRLIKMLRALGENNPRDRNPHPP
ncbi:uncharacterized protein LOC141964071 [Athene noctua]|uniref:uncharacterized protein LOC141964071 n=1 Tax=Athene noctua TaxID=126797 RepID=UPI003EB9659D